MAPTGARRPGRLAPSVASLPVLLWPVGAISLIHSPTRMAPTLACNSCSHTPLRFQANARPANVSHRRPMASAAVRTLIHAKNGACACRQAHVSSHITGRQQSAAAGLAAVFFAHPRHGEGGYGRHARSRLARLPLHHRCALWGYGAGASGRDRRSSQPHAHLRASLPAAHAFTCPAPPFVRTHKGAALLTLALSALMQIGTLS